MDFAGKVVVVTGAASGIGREIARAFGARGARLVLSDIDEGGLSLLQEELQGRGCTVSVRTVDVSSAKQVERFCNQAYKEAGRVDILCNNAGIGMGGRLEETSLEDWRKIVGVNLWGVIHGCHHFYPRMIEQGGGGHIVNLSSAAGLVPLPIMVPYCTTKHAVLGLSEALRAEAALHGIGVSAICPGVVATNITKTAKMTSRTERASSEQLMEMIDGAYVWRDYTPDRVAAAVVGAVEKNRGVVLVCPETHALDLAHKASRGLYGLGMRRVLRAFFERL